MDLVKQDQYVAMGATENLTFEDILIGRIAVQQALSQLVKDEKFKAGDVVNALTEAKLGDKSTPFEFIAIDAFKYWIEKDGEVFIGRSPAISKNEKQWTEGSIKRTFHQSFYVLLPDEIKNGSCMPLELTFKSADLKSASKLFSFLLKIRMEQKPSWARTFNLLPVLRKKDKHTWYGQDVSDGRNTTLKEQEECLKWFNILRQAKNIQHQVVDDEQPAIENENLEF